MQPLTHIFREMSVLISSMIRVFNPMLLQLEALYCTVGPFECVYWLAVGAYVGGAGLTPAAMLF